jgi:hypothetical protein
LPPSPPPTARVSFYTPNMLYDLIAFNKISAGIAQERRLHRRQHVRQFVKAEQRRPSTPRRTLFVTAAGKIYPLKNVSRAKRIAG